MITQQSQPAGTLRSTLARPLHVVGVSLGSPSRDHRVELSVLGRRVIAERVGVENLQAYRRRLLELDGQVDVIGIGGTNLHLSVGHRRYPIRDVMRAVAGIRTPIVDGSGLKSLLEKQLILEWLPKEYGISFRGRRVLLTVAADRYGQAEAFTEAGADVRFGDLMFGLNIPILLRGLTTLKVLASIALPVVTRLPFTWLYPTGAKQDEITPRYPRAYQWAEVLAGDFHFIRRYMPENLSGRFVFTNTLTPSDIEALRSRGVHMVVTPSPNLEGRSFGTNIVQAILVAVSGRHPKELTPGDYLRLVQEAGFRPRVEVLNPAPPQGKARLSASP